MARLLSVLACAYLLLAPTHCAPTSPNAPVIVRNFLEKRTFPDTGDDLPDTPNHPNFLDQTETAFSDAAELAAYAITNIDGDTTIFPHYFNEGDRANVKRVYVAILGQTTFPQNPETGNALLGNIMVQTTDAQNECSERTLAYMGDSETQNPFIVLCPNAFKKKAVTLLKGAPDPATNPDSAKWYVQCPELAANGHVSYLMNSLGGTILHEYTHFDALTKSIFGASIIDQPDGYGPVNVYDNLDKSLARLNADSYMYYALHNLWQEFCSGTTFLAPRPGIDDDDPDCGGICKN